MSPRVSERSPLVKRLHNASLTSGEAAKDSLEKLRDDNPAVFWRIVASLLPKQLEADVAVDGGITVQIIRFSDLPVEQLEDTGLPAGS